MVADNKLALNAGWDEEYLQAILAELDRDLRRAAGFDEREFEELTAKLAQEFGQSDEDAVPATAEIAVSATGDLWELPPHRVVCGDSTSLTAIEQVLVGEQAAMCFSDPPYNVNYRQPTSAGPKSRFRRCVFRFAAC